MKPYRAAAVVLAGIFALTVTAIPTPVLAQKHGAQKERGGATYTCKSGKMVNKSKKCKENGGKW
jgi:hypothetical protein